MLTFLAAYWPILILGIVIVAIIAIVSVLLAKGKKQMVYKMLYALIVEAEELFGGGTGSIKFDHVISQVYAKLPAYLRLFISYDMLSGWLEDVLLLVKEDLKKKSETPDEK